MGELVAGFVSGVGGTAAALRGCASRASTRVSRPPPRMAFPFLYARHLEWCPPPSVTGRLPFRPPRVSEILDGDRGPWFTNVHNVREEVMSLDLLLRGSALCDEFAADLGDPRRTARLQKLGTAMSRRPGDSFLEQIDGHSGQQAAYRLLRNSKVTFGKVLEPHKVLTAERCRELEEVLAVHDTTTFTFPRHDEHTREYLEPISTNTQGFYGHTTLAVSADGFRAPLGVVEFAGHVHKSKVDDETLAFWHEEFCEYKVESERWKRSMEQTENRLDGVRVIHVADREADTNEVLAWGVCEGYKRGFVIRAKCDRRTAEGKPVSEVIARAEFLETRTMALNPRSLQGVPQHSRTFPERPRRKATVSVRACSVTLRPTKATDLVLNVVEVVERNPPQGEEPVHWVLLTSEPIDTVQAVLRVVDLYRSRWTIEGFFKCVKTGCGYSKRQLESAHTLLNALAVSLPIAWQLLALRHLCRSATELAACAVFTFLQIRLLRARYAKLSWSEEPTVHEAARAIAELGGHHRSNGLPGWQVLGRGLRRLLEMEEGARLLLDNPD
jgi:hypothetical protein